MSFVTCSIASSEYLPLRVRAYLRTPVVSDHWLPLDGILMYQTARDAFGVRSANIPGVSTFTTNAEVPKLPLQVVHTKHWYNRCSWAQWGPHADGQDAWSKRFDETYASLIDFAGRRAIVDTSRGKYKGYRVPVFYRSALYVEWYCVGDAQRIAYLLSTVSHIGKKAVQGWGRVIRWEIEETEDDYSIWKDGKLMRGIPIYQFELRGVLPKIAYYGIRPPYWLKSNQLELAVPDG